MKMLSLTKVNIFFQERNDNIFNLTSSLHFQSDFANNFITFFQNFMSWLGQA